MAGKLDTVVDLLRSDLERLRRTGFPATETLAHSYGTSRRMVSAAVQRLAAEGQLVYLSGCKPRLPIDKADCSPCPHVTSSQSVARELRKSILEGAYRRGQVLPKVSYFQSLYGVSNRTVLEAFRILERESVVHKAGRSRLAGAKPVVRQGLGWAPPVILIVQGSHRNWSDLVHSDRTRPFFDSFVGEARSCGAEVILVGHRRPTNELDTTDYCGVGETSRLMSELGNRHAGTLLIVKSGELRRQWLNLLKGKPGRIALFEDTWRENDTHDECAFVAGFDEKPGLSLAIERLAALGHRNVAFYAVDPSADWCSMRLNNLRDIAASRGMAIHSFTPDSTALTVSPGTDAERAGTLEWLLRNGPRKLRNLLGRVLSLTTSSKVSAGATAGERLLRIATKGGMTEWEAGTIRALCHASTVMPLLRHADVTAVICANDAAAAVLDRWLRLLGGDSPGKLSLISFDNYLNHANIPVSSVDFGFGNLGYVTFHALLGDLSYQPGSKGLLPIRATVSERNSLRPSVAS